MFFFKFIPRVIIEDVKKSMLHIYICHFTFHTSLHTSKEWKLLPPPLFLLHLLLD